MSTISAVARKYGIDDAGDFWVFHNPIPKNLKRARAILWTLLERDFGMTREAIAVLFERSSTHVYCETKDGLVWAKEDGWIS